MGTPSGSALARIVGLQTLVQFGLDFAVSLIVARLLVPSELGAFSIGLAAVVVAQTLRSGGVNMFLVAAKELDEGLVRTSLGIAMVFSFGFAVLIFLAAPAFGHFYRSTSVTAVLQIVSATFLMAPFQIVAHGLLTRALRFRTLAFSALAGSLAGACVNIGLALEGFGAASLAWGALSNAVTVMSINLLSRPEGMVFRPSLAHWRSISAFTGWVLGAMLAGEIGPRLNELFVGRTFGIAQAAFLDRAEMLPRMLWGYAAPLLLSVITPLVAHEVRNGIDVRVSLLIRMRLFGCIFSPLLIGMATQTEPLLLALYGSQWHASIEPAFWLCIAGAISGQFLVFNASLSGFGKTRSLFMIELFDMTARVVMLVLLSRTDIEMVAIGSIIVSLATAAFVLFVGAREQLFTPHELFVNLKPSFGMCLIVGVTGFVLDMVRGNALAAQPMLALIQAIAVLAVAWLVAALIFQRELLQTLWNVAFRR